MRYLLCPFSELPQGTEETEQTDAQAERPDHRVTEGRLIILGSGKEEGFEEMCTISMRARGTERSKAGSLASGVP